MISRAKKFFELLNYKKKIFLFFVILSSFLVSLFEIGTIGLIIPTLNILKSESLFDNAILSSFFKYLPFLNNDNIIFYYFSFLFIFFTLKTIYLIIHNYFTAKLMFSLSMELSNYFFKNYTLQNFNFHIKNKSSKLISFSTVEVERFSSLINNFVMLIMEIFIIFGIFIILLLYKPLIFISIACYIFLFSILYSLYTNKFLFRIGKNRQIHEIERLRWAQENYNGIKDIKIFAKEFFFIKGFVHLNKLIARIYIIERTWALLPRVLIEFSALMLILMILIFLISSNYSSDNLIYALGLFVAALVRLLPSFNRLISSRQQISYNSHVIDTIHHDYCLLRETKFNLYEQNNKFDKVDNANIEFKKLSFTYPNSDKSILEDINFTIRPNSTIGIVGHSGVGKTTFVDLMLNLHSPTKGSILLGNKNINNIKFWSKNIGYVSQNFFLLDTNILNNIAFGVPEDLIDYAQVEKVAKDSQIYDFINTLPKKFQTPIGEKGITLSGGQKQRIAIARALYNDPSILIFDESTSALDVKTENNLLDSIYNLKNKKTLIIISHKESILYRCETIYKIENKKIVKIK